MPDTTLTPPSLSPTIFQRLAYHPFETIVAAWWIYMGGVLLSMQVGRGVSVVKALPLPHALALSAFVAVGGLGVLLGLYWLGKHRTTSWRIELAGWFLGGAGWGAYLIAITSLNPTRFGIGMAVAMVLCAAARVTVVVIVWRRTVRRIERMGLT